MYCEYIRNLHNIHDTYSLSSTKKKQLNKKFYYLNVKDDLRNLRMHIRKSRIFL